MVERGRQQEMHKLSETSLNDKKSEVGDYETRDRNQA